jgi:pimeloyl-ACP methyl ester carboxylesterase
MSVLEQIQGTNVAYGRSGGGGVAAVFVHGFLDDQSVWNDVVASLKTPGVETVQIDLAGMGERSNEAGPYTLERFADEAGAVMEALDKPVVLVGQSMGCLVAEIVATRHPERVLGLVLVTPVPLAGTHLPAEATAPFRSAGGNPEAQRGIRKFLAGGLDDAGVDRLVQIGNRIRPEVVSHLVDCWNDGMPDAPAQSRFEGPVLIVRGEADLFSTEELIAETVLSRFTKVQIETIKEAGHWPHVENPVAVAEHVDHFLAKAKKDAGHSSTNTAAGVQPQEWTEAFASKSADKFAEGFDINVVLEATVLRSPVEGRDHVKAVMAAASAIYESLEFTQQTVDGPRTYLEWKATAFNGKALNGVTVLTKNEAGQIVRAAIHHRPLDAALAFSTELGNRLDGVVDAAHFYSAP